MQTRAGRFTGMRDFKLTREEEHIEITHKCFLCGEPAIHERCSEECHKDSDLRLSKCIYCFGMKTKQNYCQMLPIPFLDLGFDE